MFSANTISRLGNQILAGEVERFVLAQPRSIGTFCLFAFGSSLPELPERVVGHEDGRTQLKPQEVVQDRITITNCFSSRLYGVEDYRKALEKAIADDQSTQHSAPSDA